MTPPRQVLLQLEATRVPTTPGQSESTRTGHSRLQDTLPTLPSRGPHPSIGPSYCRNEVKGGPVRLGLAPPTLKVGDSTAFRQLPNLAKKMDNDCYDSPKDWGTLNQLPSYEKCVTVYPRQQI
jgi:hypothetical protein